MCPIVRRSPRASRQAPSGLARPLRRGLLAQVTLGSFLSLVGCGCGGSKGKLEKITTGMSRVEVEKIMGPGQISDATFPGLPGVAARKEVWQDGGRTITVYFVNDFVAAPPEAQGT